MTTSSRTRRKRPQAEVAPPGVLIKSGENLRRRAAMLKRAGDRA